MSNTEPRVPPVRRVITGHDGNRKARAVRDDIAANVTTRPNAASTTVWCSEQVPVRLPAAGGADLGALDVTSGAPPHGARLMVMDLFPGCHGAMHRTDTLDYVIVLEGDVEMLMDVSSVVLHAGDILVQRGTIHAWTNPSRRHARMAIVLIDAEPLGDGYAAARAHARHPTPNPA